MSIKKSTKLNIDILNNWLNNNLNFNVLDVYNIVNSVFIRVDDVSLGEYINELAGLSFKLKNDGNILYAMIDICLGLHTIIIINNTTKNEDHEKVIIDLIKDSRTILENR